MPRLSVDYDLPILKGELLYRSYEFSFMFKASSLIELSKRRGDHGSTSILINSLQIEVGVENNIFLYVWGYFPHTSWQTGILPKVASKPGRVSIITDQALETGMSVTLLDAHGWVAIQDPQTGWIRYGSQNTRGIDEEFYVEFATNILVEIEDDLLHAIWLRPKIITGEASEE